ncbi:acyltransferase [Pilimelia terevasa]|uniref:Acyltransferase n=1 Tax=Pilimelia terevasa TaxID=53372 RepID=A0A8J3FKH7_9ACTN|nr:acyltransferase [Pilimelia terevasa]
MVAHCGVSAAAGGYVGVDVFFVVSGYVITRGILAEAESHGRLAVGAFYARRALRLIPAAVPVLLAVLVGTYLLQPLRVREVALDVAGSVGYFLNLRLAVTGTDYFAADTPPSPVQHFWSLAVEEQFYLVWPWVVVGLLLWAYRRDRGGARFRGCLVATLCLGVAVSFALGVYLTAHAPSWAYFATPARAWELGVGALVAVGDGRARGLIGWLRVALGSAGLAAVAACVLLFDDRTPFPGVVALVPVLGTAAVIAAGAGSSRQFLQRLLGLAPLQFIGRISYGWYLWHWPFLLFGVALIGEEATVWHRCGLAGAALAVAWLSYHLLENPVRRSRRLRRRSARGVAVGLGASAVVAALAVATWANPPRVIGGGSAKEVGAGLAAADDPEREIRRLLATADGGPAPVPANLTPALDSSTAVAGTVYDGECQQSHTAAHIRAHCMYGDSASATTVVLFGDSHAAHWFPALRRVAEERRWRLSVWTLNECPPPPVAPELPTPQRGQACQRWRAAALKSIRELRPALVVTSMSARYQSGGDDDTDRFWLDGWRQTVRALGPTRVAMISFVPFQRGGVLPCMAIYRKDTRRCVAQTDSALPRPERRRFLAAGLAEHGVQVIDPAPWICGPRLCPMIVGNLLTYQDLTHLTPAYSAFLAPVLKAQLIDHDGHFRAARSAVS